MQADDQAGSIEAIAYRTAGAGEPCVLIHGDFADGMSAWSAQLASLAGYVRLVVVDRRGYGASPVEPRPYTIASDALDILSVCDDEGVHLAGHSYGGLVALEVARRAPGRVLSLHLIEPPYLALLPEQPDVARLMTEGRQIQRQAATRDPEETAAAFFTMIAGEQGMERLRASRGWPEIVRGAERFAHSQFAGDYPPSAIASLPAGFPVTVYTGSRSHPGLRALARHLAGLVPGARLVDIPGAHHAVQMAGAAFDEALLEGSGQGEQP